MMSKKTINQKNNKVIGFTLIEALVAMTIFSIVIVIVSSIFMRVNSLQRHTANLQYLQTTGRNILEKLSAEIRGRGLDYSNLNLDTNNSTDTLTLNEDELGLYARVEYVDRDGDGQNDSLRYYEGQLYEDVNPDDVIISQLIFRVFPDHDPFLPYDDPFFDPTNNIQPRVTILMTLVNKTNDPTYQKELTLQTTISSKHYSR